MKIKLFLSKSLLKNFNEIDIKNGKLNDFISKTIEDFILQFELKENKKDFSLFENNNNKVKPSKKYCIYDIDTIHYNKLKDIIRILNLKIKINSFVEAILLSEGKPASELFYSKLLFKKKDGWDREIKIKEGRIDAINHSQKRLVELKFLEGWKGALGQVLAYSHSFNLSYSLEIWLLFEKNLNPKTKKTIEETCKNYNVKPKFVEV